MNLQLRASLELCSAGLTGTHCQCPLLPITTLKGLYAIGNATAPTCAIHYLDFAPNTTAEYNISVGIDYPGITGGEALLSYKKNAYPFFTEPEVVDVRSAFGWSSTVYLRQEDIFVGGRYYIGIFLS